jgi:hypothetical protein
MKRKAVMEFMSNTQAGGSFCAADVSSETVKEFWMAYSDVRDLDVKTYAGVHALFETFIEVLDEHLEVELSGEINTKNFDAGASGQEDWIALREESGRMKFLFPSLIERGVIFTDLTPSAWRLRTSAAWTACFGPVQTRLTENIDLDSYLKAWGASKDWDYPIQTLSALAEKMREVVLAVLHILITCRKSGALAIAHYFESARLRQNVFDELNPATFTEDDILQVQEQSLRMLCDSSDPVLATLRLSAEKAWKNIRRDGFHASDLEDQDYLDQVDLLSTRFIGALGFIERLHEQWKMNQPSQIAMNETRNAFDLTFRKNYRPSIGSRGLS